MKKVALLISCVILSMSMISCKQKVTFPEWIQFYSYEGIEEYVSSVNRNTKTYKYDGMRSAYNIYDEISYKEAKKSVSDITGTAIPRPKDGVEVDAFEASYYIGYLDAFEMKYRIDDILYVFTYSYNGINPIDSGKQTGGALHQPFGNTLRKTTYFYYGEVTKGKTAIRIYVYADDYESINLGQFELVNISR